MNTCTATDVDARATEVQPVDFGSSAEMETIRLLPVREISPEPVSWESVVVGAGIDREGREFSEAETLLAEYRAAGR